jgi:hypothetical protein
LPLPAQAPAVSRWAAILLFIEMLVAWGRSILETTWWWLVVR